MLSPEAEIETLRAAVARQFSVYGVVVSPMALTFQVGVPPGGVDAAFDALRLELVPKDYIPTITQEEGETLVHIQRRPRPRFARTQVNLILLLVTVLTTTFFGGAWNWADYSGRPFLSAESIGFGGLFFTLPLLTILGSHEMGHYLVAKRYKVQASLPFFLPSVPPLGTFGAFISMRDPIPNRRALLDIGVSGPLVGFAIAIPVTLAGLALSAASPATGLTLAGEAQPFVAVASERGLAFVATDGTPVPINQTIALGTSILLTFGVNNTGPVRESVIVTAYDPNLNAFGFVILFTSYQIGSVVTPVSNNTVTISLNSTQLAAFDLRVTAPPTWPMTKPLPQYVAFVVVAIPIDGL